MNGPYSSFITYQKSRNEGAVRKGVGKVQKRNREREYCGELMEGTKRKSIGRSYLAPINISRPLKCHQLLSSDIIYHLTSFIVRTTCLLLAIRFHHCFISLPSTPNHFLFIVVEDKHMYTQVTWKHLWPPSWNAKVYLNNLLKFIFLFFLHILF